MFAGPMLVVTAPVKAQIYVNALAPDAAVVMSNYRSDTTPLLLIGRADADLTTVVGEMPARLIVPAAGITSQQLRLPALPPDLKRIVAEVAAQVQISPALLHAVIAAESRNDRFALSPKGAVGLMQLLPATAKRFGAPDPYVARQNVTAGASYLKWLMTLFDNDLELVLAAYNAGEQAVLRAGRRIPPFAETQAYVPRVLTYLRCFNSAACSPN